MPELPLPKMTPAEAAKERIVRPWGHYKVLDHGPGFLVKALLVKGKQRLSLQRHQHRDEQWTVAMGIAVASVNGQKVELRPGQTLHIPRGAAHRIANPAEAPMVFIEVQTGEDLREDDIERLEDDYGRLSSEKDRP